jgi:hypothetical protein
LPRVVTEFDFINAGRDKLNDGSNLTAAQAWLRQVFEQGDHG